MLNGFKYAKIILFTSYTIINFVISFEKIASKRYLELYIIPIPTHARAQCIKNSYYDIHFPMVISILIILYV